jgi:hypothetical protein
VVAVAVDLDREAVRGPAGVDPAAAGGAVGLREREPCCLEPGEEAALQRAEGDVDVAAED